MFAKYFISKAVDPLEVNKQSQSCARKTQILTCVCQNSSSASLITAHKFNKVPEQFARASQCFFCPVIAKDLSYSLINNN